MRKIVGIIHPFDLYQIFYIYEDGNKLKVIKTTVDNIPNAIFELSQTYNVYQVDLSGAKHYIQGIINKIQEQEMSKYNEHKLNIKCI